MYLHYFELILKQNIKIVDTRRNFSSVPRFSITVNHQRLAVQLLCNVVDNHHVESKVSRNTQF